MNWAIVSAAFCTLATASPAAAQIAPLPETLSRLYACADLAEDAARLACYDEAAGRLQRDQSEGHFVAIDRAQAEALQQESFGFDLPNLTGLMPRLPGREEIEAQVNRVIGRGDGPVVFALTNGQRWIQVESRSAANVRPGDTVSIRRAALGSYILVTEHGPGHRVRREE